MATEKEKRKLARTEAARSKAAVQAGFVTEACVMTGRIDWQQLRMQKETVLKLANKETTESEHLTGILHFIDTIQDDAAKTLGDEIVFCDYPGQIKDED
jgi:hypothetical protein